MELSAVWENAWERIEVVTVSYTVLGVLQFIVLARYGDALSWDEPQSWLYAAGLLSVVLVGSYGSLVGKGVLKGQRTARTSALR